MNKGAPLFVRLGIVGHAEDVIHGDLVKLCELDEYRGGNIPLAQLIVAVDLL